MGDFNINLLNAYLISTTDFLNTLYSVNVYPLITNPSRITRSSASLIDNILFNSLDFEIISGLLMCDISDHLPVFQIVYEIDPPNFKGANSACGQFKFCNFILLAISQRAFA